MFEDGYVNIVGRIKDMRIDGGEELCAWLLMKPGATALDAAAVATYCEGHLSRHKVPRYVLVVDEFPMTVTGKVRKMDMRERTMEILGLS